MKETNIVRDQLREASESIHRIFWLFQQSRNTVRATFWKQIFLFWPYNASSSQFKVTWGFRADSNRLSFLYIYVIYKKSLWKQFKI